MRDALDKRVERALFKEDVPPPRVQKALSHLRVGNFDKLSLFHLVDVDDSWNALKPLFAAEGEGKLRKAFGRMRRAIMHAHTDITCVAVEFIDELEELITDALAKGVPQAPISAFYKSVMLKVSAPPQRYAAGDGRSRQPRFDMAILEGTSKATKAFTQAINNATARGAALSVCAPGGGGGEEHISKKRRTAASLAEYNAAAGERHSSVTAGARVGVPPGGHADLTQFREDHPVVEVAGVGKRRQCWNFWHPQGCQDEDCAFAHGPDCEECDEEVDY